MRRPSEMPERLGRKHLPMTVNPPDETLRAALRRLGDQGRRAEAFLDSAAAHLNDDRSLASEHAAYALREALMAIVSLGGLPPRGLKDGAKEVVRQWQLRRDADVAADRLDGSVRELAELVEGPGPNERRLELAVGKLARIAPTRATADLLDQFIDALDGANRSLHSFAERDAVEALYGKACLVLRDLFGPISVRFADMDELVAQRDPGPVEVALLYQHVGDERHLIYLYDRANGPGWFRALQADPLLLPPAEGPWTAGPYVERVAKMHPDEVSAWLSGFAASNLTATQVRYLLLIARAISGDVTDVALSLIRGHLSTPDVRFQADALLREMSECARAGAAARSLVRELLMQTLTERSGSTDAYMAAEELKMAVEAVRFGDAQAWLTMLAHRAKEVADGTDALRIRVLAPLDELHIDVSREPLETVAAAVRQGANASATAGVPLEQRLSTLGIVPNPLAGRLIAQHLLDHLPESLAEGVAFLSRKIAANESPSPEELALLRRALSACSGDVAADMVTALGPVPSLENVQREASTGALSADLIRAHRWLVAFPCDAVSSWHAVDAELSTHLGPAPTDGVLIRRLGPHFVGSVTPITVEELSALPPQEAAKKVAAWRPQPESSFLGPSAEGLADTLRQAMDADTQRWIDADPVEIARLLHHPIYISVWLQALEANASALAGVAERTVTLAELLQSEPWAIDELGRHRLAASDLWSHTRQESIGLLGRLARLGALEGEIGDRAWAHVVAAVRHCDDTSVNIADQTSKPLEAALIRPSMRALETAIGIGGGSSPTPDKRLLSLIDELLALEGVDGLHSRAMLAPQLNWLRSGSLEWFAAHEPQLFGVAAPGDLGRATFELYLEWGDPYEPMLLEQRDRIIAALSGDHSDAATQHLLHGLLWKLPGYEVETVCDILVQAGSRHISYGGRWLGRGLAEAEKIDQTPAAALWRELLERGLDADAYAGFGWMAVNHHLDNEEWLTLTDDTATATAGVVDEPYRVAERAGQTPSDPRAARIIAQLLGDDPAPWDVSRIGEVGLEVLRAATGPPREALRERLLERGFHAAVDM
jgi:hypothetical protein